MSFRLLAPEMLWSLLGLAVPLLLHLLGRGERRRVPFVGVRWLEPRPALRGLRFAPSDPALLAARLLLLALIAVALAQPSCSGADRVPPSASPRRLDLVGETDLWGALRAADHATPPGQPFEVSGAPRLDALLGSRPVLDRAVTWVAGEASTPVNAPPLGTPATDPSSGRRLRWAVEASDESDVATWRGWIEGLSEAMGLGTEEVEPSAEPDLVVRIADSEVETEVGNPHRGGSRVLVPARGERASVGSSAQLEFPLAPLAFEVRVRPLPLDRGRAVARDEQGRPLVTVEETAEGEIWRFAFPVTREATSLPHSPAWTELGWAVLRPLAERRLGWSVATPISGVLPVSLAIPSRPVATNSSQQAPNVRWQPWFGVWWAVAVLAIAERWLAARRAEP